MAGARDGDQFDPVREWGWHQLSGVRGGSNYYDPDNGHYYGLKGHRDRPSFICACRIAMAMTRSSPTWCKGVSGSTKGRAPARPIPREGTRWCPHG